MGFTDSKELVMPSPQIDAVHNVMRIGRPTAWHVAQAVLARQHAHLSQGRAWQAYEESTTADSLQKASCEIDAHGEDIWFYGLFSWDLARAATS